MAYSLIFFIRVKKNDQFEWINWLCFYSVGIKIKGKEFPKYRKLFFLMRDFIFLSLQFANFSSKTIFIHAAD